MWKTIFDEVTLLGHHSRLFKMSPQPNSSPTFHHSHLHLPHSRLTIYPLAVLFHSPLPLWNASPTSSINQNSTLIIFPKRLRSCFPFSVKLVLPSGLNCPSLVMRGQFVYTSGTRNWLVLLLLVSVSPLPSFILHFIWLFYKINVHFKIFIQSRMFHA